MSWDEALFGLVFRALRRPREGGATSAGEHAVPLDLLRDRLRVVASALAGRPVRIMEGEHVGGVAGDTLVLPVRVNMAPDITVNTGVYLWRVVAGTTCMGLPRTPGLGAAEQVTWWMPRVLARVRDEMPGAMPWFERAAGQLLSNRNTREREAPAERRASGSSTAGLPWDAFARFLLGDALAHDREDIRAWVRAAHAAALRGERPPPGDQTASPAAHAPSILWGSVLPPPPRVSAGALPADRAEGSSGTERRGRAREHVERIELDERPEHENPLVHSFEKVHTAEEYQGGKKRVDGEDDMAEQGDALDEVDLRKVVRSRTRTKSVYRADVLSELAGGDVDDASTGEGIPYDEWDGSRGAYRRHWCTLHEGHAAEAGVLETRAWSRDVLRAHARSVEDVRRVFARLKMQRRWRGRLVDGPDIDLDAMVDRHADLRAGHTPEHRLHGDRLRHARSAAMLLLLDGSLSTDAWVEGHRVLDVARDSVMVLGSALDGLDVPVSVASFHSHTRTDCRFVGIKDFGDPWELAHRRLKPLEPDGYTRMGPALRHATQKLVEQPAHRRLLVLLSDGKPTDHDAYEGKHGIEDVRQAVREAEARGVRVFALAVDASARRHLPRLFGHQNFRVLPHPGALPGALAALQARLVR